MRTMTERRVDAARRDEILCALARQLPPETGDSPLALARWLKEREGLGFRGLDITIPENDERLAFEHWVRGSDEGNLAKRIQRAFRAEQAKKPDKPAPPPAPPLVWPLGMRQRKERDPKFKLPWLLAERGGSEKVFLECLGTRTLLEVSIELQGVRVGYRPALRPGEFVEVDWERNSEVKNVVTWGGNRDHILNYESMKDMAGHTSKMAAEPIYDVMKPIAEWTAGYVASIEKVLPPDLEKWKHAVRDFALAVTYRVEDGNTAGGLTGTLSMEMERLWFRFHDANGNETTIR
ncbi:MAG: hypothetical protein ACRD6W_19820 [Nitrososphaerales archaeon]